MRLKFSRRGFLKLGAAGVASLLAPGAVLADDKFTRPLPPEDDIPNVRFYGRSIEWGVNVRSKPDVNSEIVYKLTQDEVAPIFDVVKGDWPEHNPNWYRIEQGWVHSGLVQPVEYNYQTPPRRFIPRSFLVDVSVPYVDARWRANQYAEIAYRFYYGSSYWVTAVVSDNEDNVWYRVWDERKSEHYYAPAIGLRRVMPAELMPISPHIKPEDKFILVNTETQMMECYEGNELVLSQVCATGDWYIENGQSVDYTTTPGDYNILWKRASRHMAGGDLASAGGFDLPGVPWCTYFSSSGMAFHGTYWHNNYGLPRSHGCVNVPSHIAKWVYLWTSPHVPFGVDYLRSEYLQGTRMTVV